ncbi:phage/plasmid primase, P4 family [Hyphomicrobium sp. D-2]|uniref:phage/plasmid primase, P4 family n=1 Tax=Hyphomicrobium sp. D-2 TaxID=3041621 RepID=UPI0024537BDC|nr:phage/plasmid primase, P4 family [Hyphomicrobium sp. D-2]MDH4983257.1 phage/plasmid primase, P4 family [Hyphomicrobium sp. D-2]
MNAASKLTLAPNVDIEMARQFLGLLDPDASEFQFSMLLNTESRNYAIERYGSIDALAGELRSGNLQGEGIYFVVSTSDGKGTQKANMLAARALFADYDRGLPAPEDFMLPPSLTIYTSVVDGVRKSQHFWLIDLSTDEPPISLDELEGMNRRIRGSAAGDKMVGKCNQLMRLPGFFNMKPAAGRCLVTFDAHRDAHGYVLEYTPNLLRRAFPPIPKAPAQRKPDGCAETVDDPRDIADVKVRIDAELAALGTNEPVAAGGCRHERLMYWSRVARDHGLTSETTIKLLRETASRCDPPLDIEDERGYIERCFEGCENDFGCKSREARHAVGLQDVADILEPANDVEIIADRKVVDLQHDGQAPVGSEIDLANFIAGKYCAKLRYVARWGQWLIFDGHRWHKDEVLAVWETVKREVASYAASFSDKSAIQRKLASKQSIAAVESLMRSDRKVRATVEQWDADPMLLNTPGGVVDLRTGDVRPATAQDYLTKATAVAPEGGCSRWMDFLDQITAGDKDLQAYLQRVFGYALTGSTVEHALFFGHGSGGNGKGVFVNTLIGVMADYALHAPVEVFTEAKFDRHSTELARLQGARLVVSTETEKGRRWAEARVKALTGGDPVTARYMRQDDFTFTPQFKLFVTGQHLPRLSSVDQGMKRRFNRIPFDVTISASKVNPDLPAQLREEWGGILAWGIQGCLDWQKGGLRPPQRVRDASAIYFADNDVTERWMLERCSFDDANAWTGTVDLHASLCEFCLEAGEGAITPNDLAKKLDERGLTRKRRQSRGQGTDQMGFLGIKIL